MIQRFFPKKSRFLALTLLGFILGQTVSAQETTISNAPSRALIDQVLAEHRVDDARELLELPKGTVEQLKPDERFRYTIAFTHALEIIALAKLLGSASNVQHAQSIHLGLYQMPNCDLCQDPTQLLDWVQKNRSPDMNPDQQTLLRGIWDWRSLPEFMTEHLASKRITQDHWSKLKFISRHEHMRTWALTKQEELLKTNPRGFHEFQSMELYELWVSEILGADDTHALSLHMNKARQLVKTIDYYKNQKRPTSWKVLGLLHKAEIGGDIASRFAALNEMFDALKQENKELLAISSSKPGQTLTPELSQQVAMLLETALAKEIEGTWANQELASLDEPVRIKIESIGDRLGNYDRNGVMRFNSETIERFVKVRNRRLDDIIRDPTLLKELAQELCGTYVHEKRHHQQNLWAKSQGAPMIGGHHLEQDAITFQMLFCLEKSQRDPQYASYLKEANGYSSEARSILIGVNNLLKSGADSFARQTMVEYYPNRLSLEGTFSYDLSTYTNAKEVIQTELQRRKQLPAQEKFPLNEGGTQFENGKRYSDTEFRLVVANAGSDYLNSLIPPYGALIDKKIDWYKKYRERYDRAMKTAALQLDRLRESPATQDKVPSPIK